MFCIFCSSTDEELAGLGSDDSQSFAELAQAYHQQQLRSKAKYKRSRITRTPGSDSDCSTLSTGSDTAHETDESDEDADWELEDSETEKESDEG